MIDLPTPWKNIRGLSQPRHGDLLVSLEEEHQAAREAFIAAGMHLHDAVFIPHSPRQKALLARITSPEPGDYVFIRDMLRRPDRSWYRNTGYLLCHRREYSHTQKVWREEGHEWGDQPRPTEMATYIQYGPNPEDVVRWENADPPHAIPTRIEQDWNIIG